MYTQCPECQFAFRVTAKLLQQDSGQVRCSSCRNDFNAIAYLSEDSPMPEDEEKQTSDLLEKLDELAGKKEIEIEDTGVEWRVHDLWPEDDAVKSEVAAPSSADDASDRQEMRFDDNTPLPDEFNEAPERPDAALHSSPQQSAERPQEYLDLGEPDDWHELLSEVGGDSPGNRVSRPEVPLEVDEELAAIHSELSSRQNGTGATTDREQQIDFLPGAEDDTDLPAEEKVADDVAPASGPDAETGRQAAAIAAESTISGVPASLLTDTSGSFESIVLEGDKTIGPDVEGIEIDAPVDAQQDSYTVRRIRAFGGRRKTDPPGLALIGAAILFALLLAGQLVHANRERLATNAVFNRAAAPVYRLLGQPLIPHWNIRGWQFQATKGSTENDDGVLTILSRVTNASENPLPYPLVHLSLTDRWEEIIGSRVLEPGEYLAGDLDPARLVAAGERFTAIITVESPSPEATGFKLNICYRDTPGRVRCATEDFKN